MYLGEATGDEMFLIYFAYTIYFPGDENIVIDTSSVTATHNDCDFSLTSIVEGREVDLSVYPNPVSDRLSLDVTGFDLTAIELKDAHGRLVSTVNPLSRFVDVSGLPEGIYMLSIKTDGGKSTQKVVVRH